MAMAYEFDRDAAMGADSGGAVSESGVYTGRLTEAIAGRSSKGARFVEFTFETTDGRTVKYLTVYTTNRAGERSFGYGMICSLMGLLGLNTVSAAPIDDNKHRVPEFIGKPVGIALQREEYMNNAGKLKWKMNLLHFFDAQTMQTYGEKSQNKEAKVHRRAIKDKLLDATSEGSFQQSNNPTPDDDLPF